MAAGPVTLSAAEGGQSAFGPQRSQRMKLGCAQGLGLNVVSYPRVAILANATN